jgi:hypothetical protein
VTKHSAVPGETPPRVDVVVEKVLALFGTLDVMVPIAGHVRDPFRPTVRLRSSTPVLRSRWS